jgi:hypothetical protein
MRVGTRSFMNGTRSVHRTAYRERTAIEDMNIDHRRLQGATARDLPDRWDIVPLLDQLLIYGGNPGHGVGVIKLMETHPSTAPAPELSPDNFFT